MGSCEMDLAFARVIPEFHGTAVEGDWPLALLLYQWPTSCKA